MSSSAAGVDSFRDKFALESFEDSGVLIDLERGTYFELNATAAKTCAALRDAHDTLDAVALLSERLGISSMEAQGLIHSVLADVDQSAAREEPGGPFRYGRRDDFYILEDAGKTILTIDLSTHRIHLAAASQTLRFPMLDYVRAVTPKLLGLSGIRVLHASACTWAGRTVAFSGPSGAGKTTTMRAFAAAGAQPISEDLVIMAQEDAPAICHLESEGLARAWAADTAARLSRERHAGFELLVGIARGPTRRLDEIWFLDEVQRGGTTIKIEPLMPAPGLLALLRNAFLGASDAVAWTRQLKGARALAESLRLVEARAPLGLAVLTARARDYVKNSA